MGPHALRIVAVSLSLLAVTPVMAQEADDDETIVETDAERAVVTREDGFDWGWLGLLGLLGLAGLRKRETHTVHTTTTPRM